MNSIMYEENKDDEEENETNFTWCTHPNANEEKLINIFRNLLRSNKMTKEKQNHKTSFNFCIVLSFDYIVYMYFNSRRIN